MITKTKAFRSNLLATYIVLLLFLLISSGFVYAENLYKSEQADLKKVNQSGSFRRYDPLIKPSRLESYGSDSQKTTNEAWPPVLPIISFFSGAYGMSGAQINVSDLNASIYFRNDFNNENRTLGLLGIDIGPRIEFLTFMPGTKLFYGLNLGVSNYFSGTASFMFGPSTDEYFIYLAPDITIASRIGVFSLSGDFQVFCYQTGTYLVAKFGVGV